MRLLHSFFAFALLLGWPGPLLAATLVWEPDPGAGPCATEARVRGEIERRLTVGTVASGLPGWGIHVRIERREREWAAHIERRDTSGKTYAERTVRVTSDRCEMVEQYATLIVALMLDGEPDESPAPVPANTAAVEAPRENEATTTRPPPRAPSADLPRRAGNGRMCVYVHPPVLARRGDGLDSASGTVRAELARLQSAMAARLVEREVFTVVEIPPRFEDELAARSWLQKGAPLALSASSDAKSAGRETWPAADYILVPLVSAFLVQNGFDDSMGKSRPVIVVTAQITILGLDVHTGQELPSAQSEASFSYGGRMADSAAVHVAMRAAVEELAAEVVDGLRAVPDFRLRPRLIEVEGETHIELASLRGVHDGDRFVFEDAEGRRSGYAVASVVGARAASARVWKAGNGERLLELDRYRPWEESYYAQTVDRVSYRAPSEADLARALATGRRVRQFGPAFEAGLGTRFTHASADGSAWRSLIDVRWQIAWAGELLALVLEPQAGIGREISLWRSAGLTLTVHASGGLLFNRGQLGSTDQGRANLDLFLGGTANVGATLELYRLIGAISPTIGVDAQYVAPIVSRVPGTEFLDSSLPSLHGVAIRIGYAKRGSTYRDMGGE